MTLKSYKKKIAVIENGLFSTYTMRDGLMRYLLQEGFDITVLTHTNSYVKQVEKSGIKVINIGSGNTNPLKVLQYIIRLYKALKQLEPDVCLTFSIRPAIWGNFITRRLHIPTITNITGVGPLFSSKNIAYRMARLIYRQALQKTSKVFFQNFDDMNLFIEKRFVRKEVAERIPGSGIDYEKFSPLFPERKNAPFTFLFIGRLIKDKGIFEYVQAARIIKKHRPDIIFNVIGPFWQQNLKSNTITKSDLQNWITEGIIDYEGEKKDVRKFIAEADCVVLPSYREGASNILMEASSMEKPVITTNTTGCRDIVEDRVTGMLCRVGDAADLADKMAEMIGLTPDERTLMGQRGRQKVIREFDKKIVLAAYKRAIDQALGGE